MDSQPSSARSEAVHQAAAHQFEESLTQLASTWEPPAPKRAPHASRSASSQAPADRRTLTLAELEEAAADIERYMQSLQ